MSLLSVATKAYMDGGLSLIPINRKTKRPASWLLPQATTKDGAPLFWTQSPTRWLETTEDTGKPKGTWEPYQHERPTQAEIDRWVNSGIQSIAIVAGAISGGVEVLDFDNRQDETWFEQWRTIAGDPIKRYGLALQATGGGGFQVAWRCEEIEGNQKLAWIPAAEEASGKKVMIETRGEGGYFLAPPSEHPSGNSYRLLSGRFSQIPRIEPEVRSHLLDCARQLNQVAITETKNRTSNTAYASSSNNDVADAFNSRHPIEETLRYYGYTQHGNRWSRPGKTDSLGLVVFGDGKAYAHSSNDRMAADRCGAGDNRPFTSFDLFAHYDHNEDYKAATKTAAIELGMTHENNLHTLLYVEQYANAEAARNLMFQHGWVVRGFQPDKIKTDGIDKYSNVIVWSYTDAVAKHIATEVIPGAYPLVVPGGMDAQAMAKEGILRVYLEAALADAMKPVEVMTWTL